MIGKKQMSAEAAAKLEAVNAAATDWEATCRVCKAKLLGTRKDVLAHTETHNGKESRQ